MSWNVTMFFETFFMTFDDLKIVIFDEVKSPKITIIVSKNMVTFSDISWLIMTLSNQLTEVNSVKHDLSQIEWPKSPPKIRGHGHNRPQNSESEIHFFGILKVFLLESR